MESHPYMSSMRTDPEEDDRAGQYLSFTPKRAMASFDNLVALANHQERLKQARKILWRDRGEPIAEVNDLWECTHHAAKGGFRAGAFGFGMRAGVNLVLLMFRIRKAPRSARLSLVRHAIFGPDSLRFAAMLASFAGIYKYILNALPLLLQAKPPHGDTDLEVDTPFLNESPIPVTPSNLNVKSPSSGSASGDSLNRGHDHRRTQRLSLSAEARLIYIRKQTRRWHAVVAGALAGGVAVMFEKRARRVTIAQQLFVRGLQGSFNAFSSKRGIRIPHGDILIFSLCSAQIMYAFLLRPDTLPRSYISWITQASNVHPLVLPINRSLFRENNFNVKEMQGLVDWKRTTAGNRTLLSNRISHALSSSPYYGRPHAPCSAIHPWIDSCLDVPLDRFASVFTFMLPIYGALHFIPMLVFKRGVVMKKPLQMLLRAGWGTTRSSAFLGAFVAIYQIYICSRYQLYDYLLPSRSALAALPTQPSQLRRALASILISRPAHWSAGLLCGLALFVEEKRRREELAMYVLPKALESVWVTARGRGWVWRTGNWGEGVLCAVGMGMVMSTYQNDPQHLSSLVRKIMYQFIGPN